MEVNYLMHGWNKSEVRGIAMKVGKCREANAMKVFGPWMETKTRVETRSP